MRQIADVHLSTTNQSNSKILRSLENFNVEKVAKLLTKYVIKKGMIKEDENEIYEYGFVIALEMGISLLLCLCIAVSLNMCIEGILFFTVFIPLRSYAGGLHMEKFLHCLLLSCITFSGILLSGKLRMPIGMSLLLTLIMEYAVYRMYPVENHNRQIDREENIFFKKRLKQALLFNTCIALVCSIARNESYSMVILMTYGMLVITMCLGKRRYRKNTIN